MVISTLSPAEARDALKAGARLVDIRAADEFARQHIPGATNLPIDRIEELPHDERPVVFYCKSGGRTGAYSARLATAADGAQAYILSGGIDSWRKAGEPTVIDTKQPLEIMRQVQIIAGALVLTGVVLGLTVDPNFFGLSAFVGVGLTFAGVTGWCGMAKLLQFMPWNQKAAT